MQEWPRSTINWHFSHSCPLTASVAGSASSDKLNQKAADLQMAYCTWCWRWWWYWQWWWWWRWWRQRWRKYGVFLFPGLKLHKLLKLHNPFFSPERSQLDQDGLTLSPVMMKMTIIVMACNDPQIISPSGFSSGNAYSYIYTFTCSSMEMFCSIGCAHDDGDDDDGDDDDDFTATRVRWVFVDNQDSNANAVQK